MKPKETKMSSGVMRYLLMCLAFLLSPVVFATTAEQLIAEQQLAVRVKVENKEPIVAKQPVVISVELLTQRWFGSGNRIHDFEMAQIVKRPLNEQPINGFSTYLGKKWTSQIRQITLYPMEAGIYEIPPLKVDVAVNTTEGDIKGTIETDAITLNVTLPQELLAVDEYVVTDQFSVNVKGSFDQENPYKIGEAVTLNYALSASGVPAMMLPQVPEIHMDGVGIYRKKPNLFEKSNRGELSAHREEEINFIFEKQGSYQIPEIRLYWWNSQSQSIEEEILPAQSWVVSGEVLVSERSTGFDLWGQLKRTAWQKLIAILIFTAIAYYLVKKAIVYRVFWLSLYKQVTGYDRRLLTPSVFYCHQSKRL